MHRNESYFGRRLPRQDQIMSKSERSFTDPVNGTRMILLIGCERHQQ